MQGASTFIGAVKQTEKSGLYFIDDIFVHVTVTNFTWIFPVWLILYVFVRHRLLGRALPRSSISQLMHLFVCQSSIVSICVYKNVFFLEWTFAAAQMVKTVMNGPLVNVH